MTKAKKIIMQARVTSKAIRNPVLVKDPLLFDEDDPEQAVELL